jgi:hypothetical protein
MGPLSACPLCGRSKVSVYLEGSEQRLSHSSLGSSRQSVLAGRAMRCEGCGLGFGEERRTEEDLALLYRDMDVGVCESELGRREWSAAKRLRLVRRHCATGRLLEIRCVSGLFLEVAARAGWNVAGIGAPCDLRFGT